MRCYDRDVRRVLAVAIVGALAGCALFTDFGGLSSKDTPDPTPDGSAEASLGDVSDETKSSFDANVLGLPPNTVFADSFDDATPIPRFWDLAKGTPKVTTGEVISPPNILTVASVRTAPGETMLVKTMVLDGKIAVSCAFKLKLQSFASVNDVSVVVAKLYAPGFTYASFMLTPYQWQYYGQFADGGELGDRHVRPVLKQWLSAKLTIAANGTITVIVDDIVKTSQVPPGAITTARLELGLDDPLGDRDAEIHYDDVVCTAE